MSSTPVPRNSNRPKSNKRPRKPCSRMTSSMSPQLKFQCGPPQQAALVDQSLSRHADFRGPDRDQVCDKEAETAQHQHRRHQSIPECVGNKSNDRNDEECPAARVPEPGKAGLIEECLVVAEAIGSQRRGGRLMSDLRGCGPRAAWATTSAGGSPPGPRRQTL
jgi:hypothetical protein